MGKKLTDAQIHARLDAYEEACEHLEATLGDYGGNYRDKAADQRDIEQTKVVIGQIKRIAARFQHKHFNLF